MKWNLLIFLDEKYKNNIAYFLCGKIEYSYSTK